MEEKIKTKITKREILTIVIAVALIVALLVAFTLVYFLVFFQPTYNVSLEDVKKGKILFEDEFDGESLDTTKWRSWGGKEPAMRRGGYYTENQLIIHKSNLIIRTSKVGDQYHTGAIDTLGTYEQKFGYFETRCILPKSYGIWSAFWLMSNSLGGGDSIADKQNASKYGAEIDIFESPYCEKNLVHQGVHIGGYANAHASKSNPNWWKNELAPDPFKEFHTYAVYWDTNIYKFYIDDILLWTTDFEKNVSQIPQFINLSVEIGGNDGKPNDDWCTGVINDPNNPYFSNNSYSDFVIDYVRVYDVEGMNVEQ